MFTRAMVYDWEKYCIIHIDIRMIIIWTVLVGPPMGQLHILLVFIDLCHLIENFIMSTYKS
jgi:hypothetical protein